MKILCTGSQGFVGQELCKKLEARGDEVWRFDKLVHARYEPHRPRMIYGDIRDYNSCRLAVQKAEPDVVVHLAAIATADQFIYDHPNITTQTNLDGTVNVANAFGEWVKAYREDRQPIEDGFQFVCASSSEVYGNQNPADAPFTETLEPHPSNIYGVAKWAAELHLREQWSKMYGIPYTILRNNNTYGNLGYQRTFVDATVMNMLQGRTVRLGHPEMVRDWEFRDDHVSSYLTVIGNPKAYNEVFNFCVGQPFTIRQTADIIARETGFKGEILTGGIHPRPNDVPLLHCSGTKAHHVLNWYAEYDFEHGIRKYIAELKQQHKAHSIVDPRFL